MPLEPRGERGAPFVLVVPEEASGARLDRFIVSALRGTLGAPTRTELQRWMEHGRVTVNGAKKRAADKVQVGAKVVVDPEAPPPSTAAAEDGIEFNVLYKDAHVVVVNKPAGLVVHPAKGHATGTLVNGLLGLGLFDRSSFPGVAADDDEHVRPGIVHRLDKGTSGVMIVARTPAAQESLKVQFAQHTIAREYEALCVGVLRGRTFDTLHGRDSKDRKKFTSKVREGRRAVTHVEVLAQMSIACHVLCRLETGRTHQIRMHLAEAGHGILGDPVYGKPPKSEALRELGAGLGHQALHARLLGFSHPDTRERMTFTAPQPTDFELALLTLKALPA